MRLRSVATGVLTLIALQVFSSGEGPERGGALLDWLTKGLNAALSPTVAAIPTTKQAKPSAAKPGTTTPAAPSGPVTI